VHLGLGEELSKLLILMSVINKEKLE